MISKMNLFFKQYQNIHNLSQILFDFKQTIQLRLINTSTTQKLFIKLIINQTKLPSTQKAITKEKKNKYIKLKKAEIDLMIKPKTFEMSIKGELQQQSHNCLLMISIWNIITQIIDQHSIFFLQDLFLTMFVNYLQKLDILILSFAIKTKFFFNNQSY
ncbi:hypothetical protein ABPG72_010551 [Tetrahymena utriculariae]